jgi:penicillin-insensitive murein endopeptidase
VQPYTFDADFRYGADELVAGLLWVADRVHETTGIDRIAIGNLSRRGGGDHPLSGSHESGRDVDLPFLMKNGRGTHVESLYHAFDGRGFSKKTGRRHRFDVEGNWRLVRAVIECPAFEVALIVVAPGLKKLLLEHARANDADRGLVERAERLLAPPHWARPHDNHFHLRIRCPEGDVEAGCIEE